MSSVSVITPSENTTKKPVTPSEKKEKRLKKTIRKKEQRFKETNDKNYLLERDQAQDELNELLLSRAITKKNKKIKEKKKKKMNLNVSDEQAFLEADKYNRSVKEEALKEQEKKKMREEELKGKRAFAMEKLLEKKEKFKQKNLSLKDRLQENEEKKKNWELYRSLFEQEYMVEYSKDHPYETPDLGQIDRLAKKNYEKELEIKQKEAGIKAYEEEFKERKRLFQSYIDRTDMPCGDKGKAVRDMNAHLESQIKEVRDSFPKVLKVLDKWVAKLQVVEDIQ